MDFKKIEERIIEFLKEEIKEGIYQRDIYKKYELAISISNQLKINIEKIDSILAKIEAVTISYCVKNNITIK